MNTACNSTSSAARAHRAATVTYSKPCYHASRPLSVPVHAPFLHSSQPHGLGAQRPGPRVGATAILGRPCSPCTARLPSWRATRARCRSVATDVATAGDEGLPPQQHEQQLQPPSEQHVHSQLATLHASASKLLAPLLEPILRYRGIIQRALVTLVMLALIRSGLFIPIPGVDMDHMPAAKAASAGERLLRALYGQGTSRSLFELGMGPFINASMIIGVLAALPAEIVAFGPQWMQRLAESRKEGRSGQAHLTTWTNGLAIVLGVYSAFLTAHELEPFSSMAGGFVWRTALALFASSCAINHCSNFISAHGIGSGSTLVICAGIVSDYATTLYTVLNGLRSGLYNLTDLLPLLVGYLALTLFCVYLSTTELRLPIVHYSTHVPPARAHGAHVPGGNDLFAQARVVAEAKMGERGRATDYFPLQLNSSGMMPIIMAGALWFGFVPRVLAFLGRPALTSAVAEVHSSWWGVALYGLLVFKMEFLPLGGINAREVATYFNQLRVGIRGVVPGEATEAYLQRELLRCKFWGGLALALLATAALVFDMACQSFLGTSLSTTSLLIIVGAVIQTSHQVEALLEGPRLASLLKQEQKLIESLGVLG